MKGGFTFIHFLLVLMESTNGGTSFRQTRDRVGHQFFEGLTELDVRVLGANDTYLEITLECGALDTLVPPDGALRFQKSLSSMYGQDANRLRVNLHENVGHDPTISKMWQNCLGWIIDNREKLCSRKGDK